jgi:membrane protein DedA with SNARE-associated domain
VFTAKKQMRVRAYFRKYGSKVIFVGRFLPGLRFSIFFSAGTLRVKPATFLIYDTLAAVLSVPTLVYLAWIFGERIDHVGRWARRSEYGILVIAVIAVALVAFKTYRHRKNRRQKLAAAAEEGPLSVAAAKPPAVPPAPISPDR